MQAFIAISLGLCELRIPIWLQEASLPLGEFYSAIFLSSLNLMRPSSVPQISIALRALRVRVDATALESAARAASIHIYIVGQASKPLLARFNYIYILLYRISVKTTLNVAEGLRSSAE